MMAFIRLLREHLKEDKGLSLNEARHISLQLLVSAFVSGNQPPTLGNWPVGTSLYVERTTVRRSKTLVAEVGFSGEKAVRLDNGD